MARNFDGTNDRLSFGSDASIDDFALKTVCAWVRVDSLASERVLVAKDRGVQFWGFNVPTNGALRLIHGFSTTDGQWDGTASSIVAGVVQHVAFTYDRGSTANNPVMYVDGVAQTPTVVSAPAGTSDADAAAPLVAGETGAGTLDLDGAIGHLVYHDALLTADDINRARFWGCAPGGPSTVKVWHPLWTSDLSNKGTATANGTATGTTVDNANCPRVERMWGSMMGCGR